MNFQAARFSTKLLLPLWLGFLTYLVIFLYLSSIRSLGAFPSRTFRELKNSLSFITEKEQPFYYDGQMLLPSLLGTQVRNRFRLVYTRRRKTARVLYPTAQEESSPGFSQGFFRHITSQIPSPC